MYKTNSKRNGEKGKWGRIGKKGKRDVRVFVVDLSFPLNKCIRPRASSFSPVYAVSRGEWIYQAKTV
jgi:hypothetical protein